MSEPIKIVVTAETAQATADLAKFVKGTGDGLKDVATHAGHAESELSKNRMALMELGHVARSTGEALAFGMNPLRVLALEAPRMIQANAMLTEGMKARLFAFLPALGGVALAVGAGIVAWKYYGESLVDPTKRARELADTLEKIPGILSKIAIAQRAGSIDPAQAEKYRDLLSGKTPLYNQTTVPDAYGGHAASVKNGLGGFFGEAFPQLTTDPNIRNSRTRAVIGQRQPANETDIAKYVEQLMRSDKATMANDAQNPGDEALAKLHDEELKIQRDAEVGAQKEIARIQDRYERERREIAETREVAVAAHKWTAAEEQKYQDTLTASKKAEAASVAEIQTRAADEAAKKIAAPAAKVREEYAKEFREANKQIEDGITADAIASGHKRDEFYFRENVEKMALATEYLAQGKITEEQYADATAAAQEKIQIGVARTTDEYRRQLQMKQEIARADTAAQLAAVQSNPYLTRSQKQDQSLPLMQQQQQVQNPHRIADLQSIIKSTGDDNARLTAERELVDLRQQQAVLTNKISEEEHPWATMFAQLKSEAEITMTTLATTFKNVFDAATQSISSNITGLIMGTETWGQALRNIYNQIMTSIIGAIVQMGVRWIMTQILMAIAGKQIMAAAVAATAPLAAASNAIWAAPAVAATIATAGAAAAAAPPEILLAQATTLAGSGFAEGGFTGFGGKYEVAGPVHRGEYVMPASAVDRIGVDNLAAMHHAPSGGAPAFGGGGSGGGGDNFHAIFMDPNKAVEAMQKSDAARKYFIDVMRQEIHRFK